MKHAFLWLRPASIGRVVAALLAGVAWADSRSRANLSDLYLTWMCLLSTTASGMTPDASMFMMPEAHFGFSMLCAPLQSPQSISSVIAPSSVNLCSHLRSLLREGTSFLEGLSLWRVIRTNTTCQTLVPCARP